MALGFDEIERRRQAAGISVYALCQKAHVSPLTYRRLKTQQSRRPWKRTLERLEGALDGNDTPKTRPLSPDQIRPLFKLVMAVCCQASGLPALDTIAVDPHANRPRDVNWLAAMHVRQMAIYILNCEAGVRAADISRALGVSKQAVSKTLKAMEEKRDKPAFNALLNRFHELMCWEEAA